MALYSLVTRRPIETLLAVFAPDETRAAPMLALNQAADRLGGEVVVDLGARHAAKDRRPGGEPVEQEYPGRARAEPHPRNPLKKARTFSASVVSSVSSEKRRSTSPPASICDKAHPGRGPSGSAGQD